jgi:hypothetical protein
MLTLKNVKQRSKIRISSRAVIIRVVIWAQGREAIPDKPY